MFPVRFVHKLEKENQNISLWDGLMFVKQDYEISETRDWIQSNDGLRSYIKDDRIFLNHLKH